MLSLLKTKPVESGASLLIVALGLLISASEGAASDPRWEMITAGAALTAIGGVLASWIAGSHFSGSQALESFAVRVETISRSVGQFAGQIHVAVEEASWETISEHEALTLVSQAATNIYGQVSELQGLVGGRFSSDFLLDTVNELDALARKLGGDRSTATETDEELSEVIERLDTVRAGLSSPAGGKLWDESLVCPYCAGENRIRLSATVGATRAVTCLQCDLRFNSHRVSDGSVLANAMPESQRRARSVAAAQNGPPTFELDTTCPRCDNPITTTTRPSAGEDTRRIVCLACNADLEVSFKNSSIRDVGTFERRTDAIQIGTTWKGARPRVACVSCGEARNAVLREDDEFYWAPCFDCRVLIGVARSSPEELDDQNAGPIRLALSHDPSPDHEGADHEV